MVGSQYVAAAELERALASQPAGVRIGEYLVRLGKLTEQALYECLSLQQHLEFQVWIEARFLPGRTLTARCGFSQVEMLGYKVASGQLFVAVRILHPTRCMRTCAGSRRSRYAFN